MGVFRQVVIQSRGYGHAVISPENDFSLGTFYFKNIFIGSTRQGLHRKGGMVIGNDPLDQLAGGLYIQLGPGRRNA